jgi:hypothetical protein
MCDIQEAELLVLKSKLLMAKTIHLKKLNQRHDDYRIGVLNGLEIALATIENRKPKTISRIYR